MRKESYLALVDGEVSAPRWGVGDPSTTRSDADARKDGRMKVYRPDA